MAIIIVADTDLKTAKSVRDILSSREGHDVRFFSDADDSVVLAKNSLTNHSIFYAHSSDPLFSFLKEHSADLIFVNDRFPDEEMKEWIVRMRRHCCEENKEIPISLLSYEEDQTFFRSYLESGITDSFCVPLDWPLFIQKFELLLTKNVTNSARQLYELRVTKPIDVATIQEIEEISEFGVKIKSSRAIALNEFMVFYSEAFLEHRKGEVLGRCYAVEPHKSANGFYRAHFAYVGVPPKTLQNIRRWIRQQYAIKKQSN